MTASTGRPRLARLPDEFLEELRSRVSIVEIATEYTDLKPAGAARYKGLCPFHQENTPSFTVQTDSGRYHCFGCGADGDAISLLTESGGLTFREAVEDLSDRYGLRVPQVDTGTELDPSVPLRAALNECQTHLVRWLTEHPQAGPAREFLRDRGFSAEHAALWELGFHPGGNQTLARTVNASIDTLLHAGMLAEPNNSMGCSLRTPRFYRRGKATSRPDARRLARGRRSGVPCRTGLAGRGGR